MRVLLKVPHDGATMVSRLEWSDRNNVHMVDNRYRVRCEHKIELVSFEESHERYLERHYK